MPVPPPVDPVFFDALHSAHALFMRLALDEAALAAAADEVPVGAVVVRLATGEVIARGHNERERRQDPTAHAEVVAIARAAAVVGSWRLDGCALYCTLEPCPMCAGAVVQARLPLLVYGAADPKGGACESLYSIPTDVRLNHRAQVVSGVLREECGAVLTRFFAGKRALGKK